MIVNPVAGVGGRVGLKGSDGAEVVARARRLGAVPEAPDRMVEALRGLAKELPELEPLAYPAEMGEDECRQAGLAPRVLGEITPGATTAEDTRRAAREMARAGVELILFAGGDGTARDIHDSVDAKLPALGVPAGVKIHSAVFAVTPRAAGEAAAAFLQGRLMELAEAEVMDLDEDAFRQGRLSARLYGYLLTPRDSQLVQGLKAGGIVSSAEALAGIAAEVERVMEQEDRLFLIGPGTTTRAIMERLGLPHTLLGVDVVRDKRLVAADVNESQILKLIEARPAKIVVTVIGGQGHILGRGNQQLSPRVLRQVGTENLMVVATREKLATLGGRPLLVDTGDERLNRELSGYAKVITGLGEYTMCRIAC